MAVLLSFLLFLTGFTGIHSVKTVSEVSVKAGGSISIPCLYDSKYTNNVKYLCKGYSWISCSNVVKTDQKNSEKFSISDDKNQRVFTVTIKDLTDSDTNYWCNVEIDGGSDDGEYFHMSVTKGKPSLYVDHQALTAFNGGEITINCYVRNFEEIKWCRLGSSCVVGSTGFIDRTRVTINTRVPKVFSVTMSGLTTENSGWYWCANKNLQMPVHVMVTEKPTTVLPVTTTSGLTSTSPDPVEVTSNVLSFIIPLCLLVLAIMVTLFIWVLIKRHKRTNAESTSPPRAEEEVVYSTVVKNRKMSRQAEEAVTYSDVQHVRKYLQERSDAEMKTDVDLRYSSAVETTAGDVTYSTLTLQR